MSYTTIKRSAGIFFPISCPHSLFSKISEGHLSKSVFGKFQILLSVSFSNHRENFFQKYSLRVFLKGIRESEKRSYSIDLCWSSRVCPFPLLHHSPVYLSPLTDWGALLGRGAAVLRVNPGSGVSGASYIYRLSINSVTSEQETLSNTLSTIQKVWMRGGWNWESIVMANDCATNYWKEGMQNWTHTDTMI